MHLLKKSVRIIKNDGYIMFFSKLEEIINKKLFLNI